MPVMAPRNSAGAKVPPTPPAANVNEVANALHSIISTKIRITTQIFSVNDSNRVPCKISEACPFNAALMVS